MKDQELKRIVVMQWYCNMSSFAFVCLCALSSWQEATESHAEQKVCLHPPLHMGSVHFWRQKNAHNWKQGIYVMILNQAWCLCDKLLCRLEKCQASGHLVQKMRSLWGPMHANCLAVSCCNLRCNASRSFDDAALLVQKVLFTGVLVLVLWLKTTQKTKAKAWIERERGRKERKKERDRVGSHWGQVKSFTTKNHGFTTASRKAWCLHHGPWPTLTTMRLSNPLSSGRSWSRLLMRSCTPWQQDLRKLRWKPNGNLMEEIIWIW